MLAAAAAAAAVAAVAAVAAAAAAAAAAATSRLLRSAVSASIYKPWSNADKLRSCKDRKLSASFQTPPRVFTYPFGLLQVPQNESGC